MNAMTEAHAQAEAHPLFEAVDTGRETIRGTEYIRDGLGALTPVNRAKAQDVLEDELVRRIFGFAQPLSATIARFVQHTFDDVDQLVELLDQQYGVKRGGKAGNLTFTTYDQLFKVEVQKAKLIDFGPSLSQAKALVDECVADWSGDAGENLKALVMRAFNVESGGLANRAALLQLLRVEIDDERWKRAMQAIQDAIVVKGTKRYVRFYTRASTDDAWTSVSLDAARA